MNRSNYTSALAVVLLAIGIFLGTAQLCYAKHTWVQSESTVQTAPKPRLGRPKFVLLVVDRVNWDDYLAADAPTLQELADSGAIGLMVTRTAGSPDRGGYLTLGAGTRLRAEDQAASIPGEPEGFAFNTSEVPGIENTYRWMMGQSPDAAAILQMALANNIQANAELNYPAAPGLLGETLRAHKIKVACLGNADLPGKPYRPIVTTAMDSKGQVPLGYVGAKLLEQNPQQFPQTSVPVLLQACQELLPQADFIAVDFGDTDRLAFQSGLISQEVQRRHRLEALHRLDGFLAGLVKQMAGEQWRLLIVTPHLRWMDDKEPDCRMAPVILYGSDVPAGWLTSTSTRTKAIVTNTDVAATVLDFFKIPAPPQMVGRPMAADSAAGLPPIAWLKKEMARYAAADSQRFWLIRPAMVLMMAIFAGCGVAVLLERRTSAKIKTLLRGLCLGILAWVVMIGLLGLWLPSGAAVSWTIILLGCLLLACIASAFGTPRTPAFALLAALGAIIFALGILWPGQELLRYSPLAYYPAEGARFYGIGNEFGGIFLGAFLFAFPALWQSNTKLASGLRWPMLALVVVLLGLGHLGANFGMTLAAVAAFWMLGLQMLKPGSWGRKLWVVALILVFVTVVGADSLQKGGTSHIGLAAQQLKDPNHGQLGGLIVRKLDMNWRLLQNSMWADVLGFAVGLILLVALKLDQRFKQLLQANPGVRMALYASLVGGATAFLCNDSGVLAAALCLIYPAASLAYLALGDINGGAGLDSA